MILFDKRLKPSTRFWPVASMFLMLVNALGAMVTHSLFSLIVTFAMGWMFCDSVSEARREQAALPVRENEE